MKKFALVIASVLLAFSVAAQAKEIKIAVIDFTKVLRNSAEGKTIKTNLQNQFKPRHDKLAARQKALDENIAKLQRDAAVMTPSQKTELEQKIMSEKQELQRSARDYQQDAALAENQAMQKFSQKVKGYVDQIAKDEEIDLVFSKDTVPYASTKVDITEKLMKKLG